MEGISLMGRSPDLGARDCAAVSSRSFKIAARISFLTLPSQR
jgi:hypothetical protein